MFKDDEELHVLNAIVHPAVKENIRRKIRQEIKQGTELFVLEAALLLEEHYDEICDEVWYIYANEEVRKKRLKYPEDIVKRRSRICSVHRKAGMNFWSTATVQ